MGGGDTSAREAMYAAASIAAFNATLTGVEVTPSAFRSAILAVAKELAAMVGSSSNALLRNTLSADSSPLLSGAQIPSTDSAGRQFIGSLSGFSDATDGISLTEGTKQQVDRRIANNGSFFKIPAYQFYEDSTVIRHTRLSVVANGCVWDEAAQAAAYDASGSCPLPQELEILHGCKTLVILVQEGWFLTEGNFWKQVVAEKEQDIIAGRTKMMEAPSIPSKTASVEPNLH